MDSVTEHAPTKMPVTSTPRASSTREGSRVVIIGGGPGGYEAALVARQLGCGVSIIERQGLGGSAVLTDVVPSKTLIATAERMKSTEDAATLGIYQRGGADHNQWHVNFSQANARVRDLAAAQSSDVRNLLIREGVRLLDGHGEIVGGSALGTYQVKATSETEEHVVEADVVLLATGARPRILESAVPDGERILTWVELYEMEEVPAKLIVVGSGVTGAEFADAYHGLGTQVVLISSRDQVLPGEDADAANVIGKEFSRRGMTVLNRSRAESVERTEDGVIVTLTDGRTVEGTHCLVAVGSVPNTENLGLETVGVETTSSGHIKVDRVSRTTARGIYAAGDCTGVHALASVAAMQGRIAMWHSLGDAVAPLDLGQVCSNIFTSPEIAAIGVSQKDIESGEVRGKMTQIPLARNPRAKMLGIDQGFVKLFSRASSGEVLGGVIVGPRASELIFPISLAVANRLTVDEVAAAFTVYPSLSGSIAEAARILHASSE